MPHSIREESKTARKGKITIKDLPEIVILDREIERFKKMALQNPTMEEEESYRRVAERNFLNGLERARDILFLSHSEDRKKSQSPRH